MSGSMARALGRGGQAAVVRTSKMSSRTVFDGTKEAASNAGPSDRVRRKGGGRPRLIDVDPDVLLNLDDLVEPESRGDPMSALRWTLKSTRQLADSLRAMGHQISSWTVGQLLHEMGYSLQATSKTVEGAQHPDRDAQFHHINDEAKRRLAANEPVISVDTKKKELVVGTKANNGREWQPAGSPERVDVHDFPESEVPKAVPYGVYDIGANEGWMEVGSDHDTAQFAVSAIKRWWQTMGIERYPRATRLMVTADAGGSNGYRNKLWKVELAKLAAETGLAITVCHYPPGTSKWNKVVLYTGFPGVYEVTNEAGRLRATARSSSWQQPRPLGLGSRSKPNGTAASTRRGSRSPTRHSPHCRSPARNGTASGTTHWRRRTRNIASSSHSGPEP